MAPEVCECVGSQLAVFLRQSAGTRQKGQQVIVAALSCCYIPSFTRHLNGEQLRSHWNHAVGLQLTPTLSTMPFPVFWSSLHFPHSLDLYFPEHLCSLVLCLPCCFMSYQDSCLGFLTLSSTVHTMLTQRIVGIVVQQKMERLRQWETQVELKTAFTILFTAQEYPDENKKRSVK